MRAAASLHDALRGVPSDPDGSAPQPPIGGEPNWGQHLNAAFLAEVVATASFAAKWLDGATVSVDAPTGYRTGNVTRPIGAPVDAGFLERVIGRGTGRFQSLISAPPGRDAVDPSELAAAYASIESRLRVTGHGSLAVMAMRWTDGASHVTTAVHYDPDDPLVPDERRGIYYFDSTYGWAREPIFGYGGVSGEIAVLDAFVVDHYGRTLPFSGRRRGTFSTEPVSAPYLAASSAGNRPPAEEGFSWWQPTSFEPDGSRVDTAHRQLFDSFDRDADGRISLDEMQARLGRTGLLPSDPRIQSTLAGLRDAGGRVDVDQFATIAEQHGGLIRRALDGDLAVPDFHALAEDIAQIYQDLLPIQSGAVAEYIPQLARVNPNQLAIAVCTVDGQQFSVGDAQTPFCLQSVSKTISYCLALDEHGPDAVHRHVGYEPSGLPFNELVLNPQGRPHNPMINAGAIMTCSLIRPDADSAGRFDHVTSAWRRLSGGRRIGFDNAVYLSERETADRNFSLAYEMHRSEAFRPGVNVQQTLEFYFQNCSIDVDAEILATAAASLANAGTCPLTDDQVFSPDTVRNCLSLMASCGMYDFSGEFAFTIGLPAKSGVSGGVMLVIPGVMGISIWSPRLDEHGNSVRGIEFCKRLVAKYNLHVFDSAANSQGPSGKRDPRRHRPNS